MRLRPWPIVILAFLNIVAPIFNVALSAYLSGSTISAYLHTLFATAGWYEIAIFFLAPPFAGFSIFLMQIWSYPVFILLLGLATYSNYVNWSQNPDSFGIGLLIGTFFVNLGLVSYFLIPEVRLVYFNRRVRWWEAKPRFHIEIRARLRVSERDRRDALIKNFSEGGALIVVPGRLRARRQMQIEFEFMGRAYSFTATAIHRRRNHPGGVAYGIQFVHDADTLELAQRLAGGLDLLGCASNRNPIPLKESFLSWSKSLAKTGRGWVPDSSSDPAFQKNPTKRK